MWYNVEFKKNATLRLFASSDKELVERVRSEFGIDEFNFKRD